jgi:hypothetical protein
VLRQAEVRRVVARPPWLFVHLIVFWPGGRAHGFGFSKQNRYKMVDEWNEWEGLRIAVGRAISDAVHSMEQQIADPQHQRAEELDNERLLMVATEALALRRTEEEGVDGGT